MSDYYSVLGVPNGATADQIKRAYRDLALKYHPDRNHDKAATEKFKEINEAYAVLGDPEKRKQYDAYGPEGFGQRYTADDIFRGSNFQDIFKDMGINFDFGSFGGGDLFGDQFQQSQQDGVNITLSFKDLENGVDREFEVQHYKVCTNCKGNGGEPGSKQIKCSSCNGTGRRHIQQNTMFGRFEAVTTCSRCRGKGKMHEKICGSCGGNGRMIATERFRVKAGMVNGSESSTGSDSRKKFGFF